MMLEESKCAGITLRLLKRSSDKVVSSFTPLSSSCLTREQIALRAGSCRMAVYIFRFS